jgi:hypothetical protein
MSAEPVIILHAAATWAMVGLIWFVQLVHYPLFAAVGTDGFVAYEAQHTRRTTWVVAVLMPVEVGTALLLTTVDSVPPGLAWTGAVLVVAIWLITLLVQVPQHRTLGSGFSEATWRALVRGNWIRTAAWSLRGVIAAIMLAAL